MLKVTFRSAHIYDQPRKQEGFVWREGSTFAVRERPTTGRKKVWSLQHIPSGMAVDSMVPPWATTKFDKLYVAQMLDENRPDDVAIMSTIPFGGGKANMHQHQIDSAMECRRYALSLWRS